MLVAAPSSGLLVNSLASSVTGAAHQGVSELPGNRYLQGGEGRLSAQLVVGCGRYMGAAGGASASAPCVSCWLPAPAGVWLHHHLTARMSFLGVRRCLYSSCALLAPRLTLLPELCCRTSYIPLQT